MELAICCLGVLVLLDILSILLLAQGETLSWKMSVLAERFQMGNEASIPTWATSVLLAVNAVLLFLSAWQSRAVKDGRALFWAGLGVIILLLSAEEVAQFHEEIGSAIRHRFNTSGVFHYAWTIPGGLFALMVFLIYARFLFGLTARLRNLIFLSGGVYVLGAIGAELVGSAITSARIEGRADVSETQYLIVVLFEETLEFAGQALFAYALVDHLASRGFAIRIRRPGA